MHRVFRLALPSAGLALLGALASCADDALPSLDVGRPDAGGADAGPSDAAPDAEVTPFVTTAALAFDPRRDGFSFANYGPSPDDLLDDDVRELLGDDACDEGTSGAACPLSALALAYQVELRDLVSGGHCYGMAMQAGLFFSRRASTAAYGAASTFALDEDAPLLRRRIAVEASKQIFLPSAPLLDEELVGMTANDVLARLEAHYATSNEPLTLTLSDPDIGGHAVNAIGVERRRGAKPDARVLVYDNNSPGVIGHVDVDAEANAWTYVLALNSTSEAIVARGDAASRRLILIPSVLAARPHQRVAGGVPVEQAADERAVAIVPHGPALVRVEDESGARLGVDANGIVDTAPRGAVQPFFGGLPGAAPGFVYHLVPQGAVTATLDGTRLARAADAHVTRLGAGVALSAGAVSVAPGETHLARFAADGRAVEATPSTTKRVVLRAVITRDGADFDLEVTADVLAGRTLRLSADVRPGHASLTSLGGAARADVRLSRALRGERQTFGRGVVRLAAGDTTFFDLAAWAGEGQPLDARIDRGSDGTIDASMPLADEP